MEVNENVSTTTETVEPTPVSDEDQIGSIIDDTDNVEATSSAEDTNEDTQVDEPSSDDEPKGEPKNEPQDNKEICPDKFKKEDGSPDFDKLLTSYNDLQKGFTQKMQEYSNRINELEKAKQEETQRELNRQGFNSEEDRQIAAYANNALVQGYLNFLHEVDDAAYVQNLIYAYSANPSRNLLEQIEDNFTLETVKEVSSNAALVANNVRNQLEQQRYQQENERLRSEATAYVQKAVDDFPEMFKVQEIVDFFGDALKTKGDTFEAKAFFDHINKLRDYFRKEYAAELQSKKENDRAIKSLVNQTPSTKQVEPAFDYENCTPDELESEIAKLI